MRLCVKLILLFIILLLSISNLHAQSRAQLEAKKNKILKEIELTSQLLNETKKTKSSSLSALKTLENQIAARNKLINNISQQINMLNENISRTDDVINAMEEDLKLLKENYAKMIYYAYKTNSSYNRLLFIFSAGSFNDMYKRVNFLKRYSAHRKKQLEIIEHTKAALNNRLEDLEAQKIQKQNLLSTETQQKNTLHKEKEKKNSLVQSLKKKEKELLADIQKKKRDADKLNKAIEDIIKKEIELAKKKAAESNSAMKLTPEAAKLSQDFATNKGALPWPVERGVITGTFGEHPHPILKSVKVKNNGIDIKSPKGSIAKSIFAGQVVNIVYNPGFNNAVIIKHGEYFTVYSNIGKTFVKAGDEVLPKQELGVIFTDDAEGLTQIHLEIWKGTSKLDPALWIAN